MTNDKSHEETENPMVNEPVSVYDAIARKRVFSEDELSNGISLEESRRRVSEMIYNFYHTEA